MKANHFEYLKDNKNTYKKYKPSNTIYDILKSQKDLQNY
jgi:hypothetical protein